MLVHDLGHNKENSIHNKDCSNCCRWLEPIEKAKRSREEYRSNKLKMEEESIYYNHATKN